MIFNPFQLPASIDLDMPAWQAVYSRSADTFVFRDRELHRRATEAWAAQRHPDGVSWWVATRQHSPSGVIVYRLSATGLALQAFSLGGPRDGATGARDVGGIAFSPDGRHLAMSSSHDPDRFGIAPTGEVWAFDFDCSTGRCTSPTLVDSAISWAAGICYSPQGSYLYGQSGETLLGYDSLCRWRAPALAAGAYGPKERLEDLRARNGLARGPDGRMYGGPSLAASFIDRPDRWAARDAGGTLLREGGATGTAYTERVPFCGIQHA